MKPKLDYIAIGKIVSTHGVKGDVVLAHHLTKRQDMNKWDAIMIELNANSYIPYFIESLRPLNDTEILCKLEEIDTPEQAREILNCSVYAPPGVTPHLNIKNDWASIIGFQLQDTVSHTHAIIQEVTEIAGQSFFNIVVKETDILVPIHENFIRNVDVEHKIIQMQLPDGFFEAFL